MKKLSVVLPVYNVESYVSKCIDSILNQTFKDFELIIIDDGSTDSSSAICEHYKNIDSRIQLIKQKNQGLSAARNHGIQLAQGEFISFIDSDDWIDSTMYADLLSLITSDVDIVVCGHRVVTESGEILEQNSLGDMCLTAVQATKMILKDQEIPSFAWNKLFRRSLFNDIKFPVNRIYEDTACIYKLFHISHNIKVTSNIYYNYLRNPNSICLAKGNNKARKRALDNFLAFYERYCFAEENIQYHEVLDICANKAILMGIDLLHAQYLYHFDKELRLDIARKVLIVSKDANLSKLKKIEIFFLKNLAWLYYKLIALYFCFK